MAYKILAQPDEWRNVMRYRAISLLLMLFPPICAAETTTSIHFTTEEIPLLAVTHQLYEDYALGHARWHTPRCNQCPSDYYNAGLVCVVRNLLPNDMIEGYMIGSNLNRWFHGFRGENNTQYLDFISPSPNAFLLATGSNEWGRLDFRFSAGQSTAIGFGPKITVILGGICEMSELSLTVPDYASVYWMGGAVPTESQSFSQVKALYR